MHKAVLLDGQKVAVKIKHPRVEEYLAMDVTLLFTLSSYLAMIPGFGWLRVPVGVREFANSLLQQTDFMIVRIIETAKGTTKPIQVLRFQTFLIH